MNRIVIDNYHHVVIDGLRIMTATVDGESVQFEFPENIYIRSIGDAYIAITLLEAMAMNRDIQVEESIPVSNGLLNRISTLQDIYCCWNKGLKRVKVIASSAIAAPNNKGSATFFSAGVDGSYTLLKHFDEISHLIILNSFEGWRSPQEWPAFLDKQRAFCSAQGKQILEVSGNFRDYAEKRKISHHFQHGLELGGIASALGFDSTYIPSSFTADQLFPWGSHPLTDLLWGGSETEVIHHGFEFSRTEKTAALAENQALLDNLQVCWARLDGNCGNCPKCLRTMLTLKLLGIRSNNLPELEAFSRAAEMPIGSIAAVPFATDIMELATAMGEHALAKMFYKKIRRFHIKQHSSELFNLVTGNRLKSLYHRVQNTKWTDARVTMTTTNVNQNSK
ncbi:MAG: hypothetical protein CME43_15005 [Haliea sp.]|uniref:hypothetical protein n=1 Tax=Haliea sp. TaxID=1932666 RepID=UPI000C46AB68|nr:hypothetical protein [Haliea sp.]MBM70776.1 hypothetical protein [Haliea sp.]|tara:strand:- start:8204 stop:9382 length:1179 start_codon:yes stop_codon:yes gene_type:complete